MYVKPSTVLGTLQADDKHNGVIDDDNHDDGMNTCWHRSGFYSSGLGSTQLFDMLYTMNW